MKLAYHSAPGKSRAPGEPSLLPPPPPSPSPQARGVRGGGWGGGGTPEPSRNAGNGFLTSGTAPRSGGATSGANDKPLAMQWAVAGGDKGRGRGGGQPEFPPQAA